MLADGLFGLAVILIPGYLFFRIVGMGKSASLSFAPLIGLFVVTCAAFGLRFLGINADWRTMLLAIALLTLVLAMIGFLFTRKKPLHFNVDFRLAFAACLVSLVAAAAYYVIPLDSALSFYQQNDNVAHLTAVRTFLETGQYCYKSITTYPALWRTLVALIASFGGSEITVAANAVNLILITYVYPAAMASFIEVILPNRKCAQFYACLLTSTFTVFPWGLLLFGPLYPNVIGNALLPLAMTAFALCVKGKSFRDARDWAALFVLSCVMLLYAHPNSLFTGVVVLSPLCVHTIWTRTEDSEITDSRRKMYCAAFAVFVLAVWTALYKLPMLSRVVSFDWPAYTTVAQSLVNVVTLALTRASAPQYVLGAIVLVGLVVASRGNGSSWIVASYCLLVLIYVVDVAIGGRFQHFFAGFWFSDSFRVASSFVYVFVPRAGLGCDEIFSAAGRFRSLVAGVKEGRPAKKYPVAVIVLLVVVLYPNFDLPMNCVITTGFGLVGNMITSGNNLDENYNALDIEEIEFIKDVHELVGDEALLNYPYDGSAYAYAIDGLNVVNRGWYQRKDEDGNLKLLRKKADALVTSLEVREAYKATGIRYVILLDIDEENGGLFQGGDYSHENWVGLEKLNDCTPGYKIILSRGDMRLYEID